MRVLVVAALVGTGVVALSASPAYADSLSATLLARSVGSAYAVSGSSPDVVVRPGAPATFALQVKNTGSTLGQYRVKVNTEFVTDPQTISLKVGALEVSSLALSSDGYVTAPIAAGKIVALTLKVTGSTTAAPNARWDNMVRLFNLGNTQQLGFTETFVEQTSTAGTGNHDVFVNGPGQLPVADRQAMDSIASIAGAPAIKVGTTSTFTLKVVNHTGVASQPHLRFENQDGCNGTFSDKIKLGSLDVTSLISAADDSYVAPVIAPGKTLTFTIAIKLVTAPTACAGLCCTYFVSDFSVAAWTHPDFSDDQNEFIDLNYAA
jgi:hypothetical protein